MSSSSDRDGQWLEFLELVGRRAGMYTATASLAEISALLVGFDNGVGIGVMSDFQEWISDRHPESPKLIFAQLVLHEASGNHDTDLDMRRLSDDDNALAVATLLTLMKRFLGERGGESARSRSE